MKGQFHYTFDIINECNMCGSPCETHIILGSRLNQSQGKNPRKKIGITTKVVKCTACALVYSNPRPTPFSIQDHYGVPAESYWKEDYFMINDKDFKGELNILNELLLLKEGA